MLERRRAIVLLILGAVLFGGGAYWFATRDFTPEASRPSFDGRIEFATTDDRNTLAVEVTPMQDPDSGQWSVLRLDISPVALDGPVAVALMGDARLSSAARPAADTAVPDTEEAPAGALRASGMSAVYFSPEGRNWPGGQLADGSTVPTDVIVGRTDGRNCGDDRCGFTLEVPLSEPVITVSGGAWSLSSPTFGAPLDEDPVASRGLFPFTEPRGSITDKLFSSHDKWFDPSDLDVRLDVQSHVADSLQQTGTEPTRALGGVFRGTATSEGRQSGSPEYWPNAGEVLKADALFLRPQVLRNLAAKQARQQFYAGILLSLAGSLLVWAAELWLGPRIGRQERTASASRSGSAI